MKRWILSLCVLACLCAVIPTGTVSAAGVYVTDYSYMEMVQGAEEGTVVYTAYEADRSLSMGTMNAQGEQTREAYSATRFAQLVKTSPWSITVHGDAAALCPYAHTHRDNTVCPYMDVLLVTMRHEERNITLENYYIPSKAPSVLPEGSVHFCFGRYGYRAPLTLRYDEDERYMALQNSEGLWGVFDTQTNQMATAYCYADMDTPYGTYVKVSNGEQWGRLNLNSTVPVRYAFADSDSFSIREEARAADGGVRIYSKDNEVLSPLIEGEFTAFSYSDEAHLLLATATDGTSSMYDVTGTVVASFTADQQVRHLFDTCYAVEKLDASGALIGTALLRMEEILHPDETVVKGDVTLDGLFNTSDVRAILLRAVTGQEMSHRRELAADMDSDGTITTTDAKMLLQQILL